MNAPWGLRTAAWAVIAFLHIPLALIILYAFSAEDKSYVFPPPALTTQWFAVAWERPDVWRALRLSFEVSAWSTAIALLLGTLAAAALARASFFGRDAISLLLILPIALPGIISGIALRSAYNTLEIPFSFWTIVIGHATFCVVVVYNNAVARLRRSSPSLLEASAPMASKRCATWCCRSSARRCWPARCSRSRSASTKSSSPPSPPASRPPCRSGCCRS